jgi:phage shock protein A
MMSNIKDKVIEDFEKYNEDPNKTVEQFIEDMNALYAEYNPYNE